MTGLVLTLLLSAASPAAAELATTSMAAARPAVAGPAVAGPAMTGPAAILGTIPAYPGATRPFGALESQARVLALTADKPEAVVGYYYHGLVSAGWTPAPEVPGEAAAAKAGKPAWLTFTRAGAGRIDIQVVAGLHPRTGKPVTVITYETQFKP